MKSDNEVIILSFINVTQKQSQKGALKGFKYEMSQ